MEIVYLLRVLSRKKWLILFFGILGTTTAFLLTLNKPKKYRSQSQLSTGFTLSEEIKLSNDNFNMTQIDVKFNNVIENITSPKVLNLLSYRLIMHDLNSPQPFKQPDEKVLEKNPALANFNKQEVSKLFLRKYDSLMLLRANVPEEKKLLDILKLYGYDMEALKKELDVSRFQRTDYINIVFLSTNPDLSAFVVDNLIKEFLRYYDNFIQERSLEARAGLDSMVRKRKMDLDEAIAAKVKFVNDSIGNQGGDMTAINAAKIGQLGMYESGLADEMSRVQNLTYQIQQLEQQLAGMPNEGGGQPAGQTDNGEFLELRRQYGLANEEYIRTGSSNAELRKKMDDLQKRMRVLASSSSGGNSGGGGNFGNNQRSILLQNKINLEGQLRSSNSKITFYRAKIAESGGVVAAIAPKATDKLEQFDKEIEIATTEYSTAKEKQTLASTMTDGNVTNFLQTIYGQPALRPEPGKRLVTMALAGVSGVLLSSLVFLLIAYVDQSVKSPINVERLTGLKVLGTVQLINLKAASLANQVVQFQETSQNRKNNFRESLRKIRYELEASGKRILLFTSTEPQQGKTTLIQALAFGMSLSKLRVLIIDTNFCNNDLSVQNNADPTLEKFDFTGLADEKLGEAIEAVITHTPVENVDIVGCSGGDYTPTEILPRNHLLRCLPRLLNTYDFVFMEGAPINHFTDAKELSPFAEGIIMVISSDAKIEQVDKASIKFFKEAGNKFLGVLLNKANPDDINVS